MEPKPKISLEYIQNRRKREHRVFQFPNGYGASVIRHEDIYGYHEEDWEVAVLRFTSPDPHDFVIVYDTPICYDVIPGIPFVDVLVVVRQIAELPAVGLVTEPLRGITGCKYVVYKEE
jgi:hypothetical protein